MMRAIADDKGESTIIDYHAPFDQGLRTQYSVTT